MHAVITGATGFLGSALVSRLLQRGWTISALARQPARCQRQFGGRVASFPDWRSAPAEVDAVINLAGEPLAGARWSAAKKARIRDSRLGITSGLGDWLAGLASPPAVLLSGSAIGYYGYSEERLFSEEDAAGDDFGARLCADWEAAARAAAVPGTRICLLRTGVVLHPAGGALRQMLPAFRLGLGGPIGSGRQWLSWIHRDDWIAAVDFLLSRTDLSGPFNLTAPAPVRNEEFSRALAAALHRACWLRVPATVLRAVFGEGADLLLHGQRVLPQRLSAAGFAFARPGIAAALAELRPL